MARKRKSLHRRDAGFPWGGGLGMNAGRTGKGLVCRFVGYGEKPEKSPYSPFPVASGWHGLAFWQ